MKCSACLMLAIQALPVVIFVLEKMYMCKQLLCRIYASTNNFVQRVNRHVYNSSDLCTVHEMGSYILYSLVI